MVWWPLSNELEKIWKEVVVAQFEFLTRHAWSVGNNPLQISALVGGPVEIWTYRLHNTNQNWKMRSVMFNDSANCSDGIASGIDEWDRSIEQTYNGTEWGKPIAHRLVGCWTQVSAVRSQRKTLIVWGNFFSTRITYWEMRIKLYVRKVMEGDHMEDFDIHGKKKNFRRRI